MKYFEILLVIFLSSFFNPAIAQFGGGSYDGYFSVDALISNLATTNSATSITTNSAVLNGTVNANGNTTTVTFEYGTTTSYGSAINGTPNSASGTGNTNITATLTGLQQNTFYHFRIKAESTGGTQYGLDQSFTTIVNAPTSTTSSATSITINSVVLNGIVNANGNTTTITFEYGTTTSYGNSINATPNTATGTGNTNVTANLSSLLQNSTYHYRIKAVSAGGTLYGSDQSFKTLYYPSSLNISSTFNFPDYTNLSDYKGTEYQIVGFPGNYNVLINQWIVGTQDKDWKIFKASGSGLVKFDGSDNFLLKTGRGFLALKKGIWLVSTTAASSVLNSSQEIEIPVFTGWNFITNPYTISIQWSIIQSYNNISEPIYAMNNNNNTLYSFSQSSILEPYKGFCFYSSSNSIIKIPYTGYYQTTLLNRENLDWRVDVILKTGNYEDRSVYFGISDEAKKGLDKFEVHKPNLIDNIPSVYFKRTEWDTEYSEFANDIKPISGKESEWDFEVKIKNNELSNLIFSGINRIPDFYNIYLIDEERGRNINLREDSIYFFTPYKEISRFKIIVGKEVDIKEKVKIPSEFILGRNYPNPFNPSTIIPVAIPKTSVAKLAIYNILGKEIKVLHSGMLTRGEYNFEWDGKDEKGNMMTSGIYIYRLLVNNGENLNGKMILMK